MSYNRTTAWTRTRSKPLVNSWRRGVRARGPPLWREGRARRHFGGAPSVNPSRVGLKHLKQLSLVCTAILKRQAEALTSLPPGKSSMCEKEDLQIFGLLQRVCEHTRYCLQVRTPSVRGILTAIAEIGQEAVFKSPHPLADGSLIRAVRLAVSAEKAYDAPKKTDARKIIALGQALLRDAGLAFNSPMQVNKTDSQDFPAGCHPFGSSGCVDQRQGHRLAFGSRLDAIIASRPVRQCTGGHPTTHVVSLSDPRRRPRPSHWQGPTR